MRIEVTAARVPLGWDRAGEAAALRETLQFVGAQARLPLFLVPAIRSGFRAADLDIEIRGPGKDRSTRLRSGEHHPLRAGRGHPGTFTVSGKIPPDADPGDIYLLNVTAHYPATPGRAPSAIEFLEVIYVK